MYKRMSSTDLNEEAHLTNSENQNTKYHSIKPSPGVKENGKTKWPACCRRFRPFLGLFYVILSSIFLVFSSAIVKKLTYISPGQFSLVRNVGIFAGNLPIAVFSVRNILGNPNYRWTLIFRSLIGATALYIILEAYRYLPIAEASIVLSTTPALVSIVARVYLKEPCGIVLTMTVVITIIGMLLSVRLPEILLGHSEVHAAKGGDMYITGLCCAISAVVVMTFVYILVRKMKHIHFSIIQLHIGFWGSLENVLLVVVFDAFTVPKCEGWDIVLVLLMGVLGFLGSTLLTLAVLSESASVVSVMKSCMDIVVSLVLQVLIFDQVIDAYNLAGAFLVMTSVTIVGVQKWLLTLPEYGEKKNRLRFLLL